MIIPREGTNQGIFPEPSLAKLTTIVYLTPSGVKELVSREKLDDSTPLPVNPGLHG